MEFDGFLARNLDNSISNALDKHHVTLSTIFAQRIYSQLMTRKAIANQMVSEVEGEWKGISSLSELIVQTGGKYEYVRSKWVGAGLPMRRFKGDREQEVKINDNGLADLSIWISRRGFQLRLPMGECEGGVLVEIRRLESVGGERALQVEGD